MAPEPTPQEIAVLASFPSRREAEHTVSSLGREFRRKALNGHASALVVSSNPDGSLNERQSRVITASGVSAALIHVSLSWTIGFMGLFSGLKGAKRTVHAVHVHEGQVGADEHPAHAILAEAGPHAAILLITCKDQTLAQKAIDGARDRAVHSWNGSRQEFLDSLDSGPEHDWVRHALGEPSVADASSAGSESPRGGMREGA
jgi:hypothetical protein